MSQRPSTAVLRDRYRLLERIAAGGMGTAWRAEDTVLHRGRAHGGAHRRSRDGRPPSEGGRCAGAPPRPDAAARRLGVVPQFVKRPSNAPENTIFRQIPPPGTEVATGSTVILLVSGGSGEVTPPETTTPPPPPKDHGGKDKGKPKPDHGKGKGKHR